MLVLEPGFCLELVVVEPDGTVGVPDNEEDFVCYSESHQLFDADVIFISLVLVQSDYLDQPFLVLLADSFDDERLVPHQDVTLVCAGDRHCARQEYCLGHLGTVTLL